MPTTRHPSSRSNISNNSQHSRSHSRNYQHELMAAGGTRMKLFGWTADTGGCAWYRIIAPLETLQANNKIEVQISQLMPQEIALDPETLIVLQRSTNPAAMVALEAFKEMGKQWVYDLDDLLWAVEPDNPAYNYFGQRVVRDRLTWHMKNAPAFTASTETLAQEMRNAGAHNVTVTPNTLPQRVLNNIDKIIEETPRNEQTTIFWRGSPTHKNDIKTIRYAMKRWANNDEVKIILAGTDYRKELAIPNAEYIPWVADPEQYLYTVAATRPDIVMCPLAPTRFNYSKSHVNALEASAMHAIPICSDIQAYETLITHEQNGYLLSTNEHHWDKTLQTLIKATPQERHTLQQNARNNTNNYTTENWEENLLNAYKPNT